MTKRPTESEDEQRQIAELVRSFDAPAPESLHRQVELLLAGRRDRGPTRRGRLARRSPSRRRALASPLGLAGAGAVTAVVVAVALVVSLSGGGAPAMSMRQAVAPTLRAATLPAPPESSAHHAQLAATVDGVPFPYWEDRFGWRSIGARTDRIDGRSVMTVFYADPSGRRIGYAILAGAPAPRIGGGVIAWRGGVPYRLLAEHGAAVVTWLRDGRLCVISGRDVPSATLLRLASWSEHDATPS